jgi:ubiquinone/menaquinone biosynthesis C-methylase UbiE
LTPPRPQDAVRKYRSLASGYDRWIGVSERYRRAAIERLRLERGQSVLDVACGTGASFPLLEERIGPEGRIVGVDLSPDMLRIARERAEAGGHRNVTLIESPVEDASLPHELDAALISLAHDVLQSRAALENVFASLRPGARVATFGGKWAPRWRAPVNLVTWLIARRYVTTFEGFDRPWRHLGELAADLEVEEVALGAGYVAWGVR